MLVPWLTVALHHDAYDSLDGQVTLDLTTGTARALQGVGARWRSTASDSGTVYIDADARLDEPLPVELRIKPNDSAWPVLTSPDIGMSGSDPWTIEPDRSGFRLSGFLPASGGEHLEITFKQRHGLIDYVLTGERSDDATIVTAGPDQEPVPIAQEWSETASNEQPARRLRLSGLFPFHQSHWPAVWLTFDDDTLLLRLPAPSPVRADITPEGQYVLSVYIPL